MGSPIKQNRFTLCIFNLYTFPLYFAYPIFLQIQSTITLTIVGHESIATTEIYTHVDEGQLQAAVNSDPLAMIISLTLWLSKYNG